MPRPTGVDEERRTAEVAEALMRRGRDVDFHEPSRPQLVEERVNKPYPGDDLPPAMTPESRRVRKPFERKPFGSWDQKLAYPSREGFHRHWFNDEPGRIMRARDAGYTNVEDESGRPVSTVVGIGRGGQPLVAFLMEIPQEYRREDMAAQESVVQDLLAQIGRGEHTRPQGPDGNFRYAGPINIETGNRARR